MCLLLLPMQLRDECKPARQLMLLSQMINQTVGDAISGILAVEAALRYSHGNADHYDWVAF